LFTTSIEKIEKKLLGQKLSTQKDLLVAHTGKKAFSQKLN